MYLTSSWYADRIHFRRSSCKAFQRRFPWWLTSLLHSFITGFLLEYIRSWRTGPLLSRQFIHAWLYLTGSLSNKVVSTYMEYSFTLWFSIGLSLQYVADAGSLALLKPLDLSRAFTIYNVDPISAW